MPTLNWIGKDKVVNHHMDVPYKILEHQYGYVDGKETREESKSGNKIIHGDNLEALKALLPEYEGRIDCIYIDPPYNTGNENWVYNDNVNDPKIKKWLGEVVGKEGDDLSRHDKWLCMMYPRLKLLYKLLSNSGSIWISIDDSEVHSMRMLLDEIFGRSKFIASNIWQKRYSRENREAIGDSHEYLLVYSKRPELFKEIRNKLPLGEKQTKLYKNPDNDPKGAWQSVSLTAQGYRPNQMYEIVAPSGLKHLPPDGRCWSMVEKEFQDLFNDGRIYFGKDGKGVPRIKLYLSESEGLVPWTWWPHEEVGHTDESRKEIQKLFGSQTVFDTPKPTRLIERVCQIAMSKNDIVLDSFAGSGTTAHSILNLNKKDGGNRKFILVEMEDYVESVTTERVKKAINGYGEGNGQVEGTGGSFDFYNLGQPLFLDEDVINEEVGLDKIREYVWFSETRQPYHEVDSKEEHLLGTANSTAYYFYYFKDQLTTLDDSFLRSLKTKAEQYIIYADNCVLDAALMQKYHITFKKIPRDITRF